MPKISELFIIKSSAGSDTGTAVAEVEATAMSLQSVDDLAEMPPMQVSEVSSECDESSANMARRAEEHDSVPKPTDIPATSDDLSNSFSFDLGLWPARVSSSMREYWAAEGSGQCQNLDADFSESSTRFEEEKYYRQCQKSLFKYTHQLTKQKHPRTWLCYSPSEYAVYCFACKLMTDVSLFGLHGYKDWKRASQSIPRHERNSIHQEAMVQLLEWRHVDCHIDATLVRQNSLGRLMQNAIIGTLC